MNQAELAAEIAAVSVLYREPKLLKVAREIVAARMVDGVSVLYREPKLLKVSDESTHSAGSPTVSVLYREPKLLKGLGWPRRTGHPAGFSALP